MKVRRYVKAIFGGLVLGALLGCGSATNNDQGASFTLLGFFPEGATSASGEGLTGISFPLTNFDSIDSEPSSFGGSVIAAVGLSNNLSGQGIRVQRIALSYYIPGASAQPPTTTFALSRVLGPGPSSGGSSIDSTLPAGFDTAANSVVSEVLVVPASIREWLAFNREQLPEPPFVMEITAYATGITTAGDRLDTNEGVLTAEVTADITIPPSDGGDDTDAAFEEEFFE